MFKKYLKKFTHALAGIWHALTKDQGFRIQIYLGIGLIVFVFIIKDQLNNTELMFIALAYTLVLITELQNSALESALNKVHPEVDSLIKNSKDMAAGAVLLAGIFLLLTLMFSLIN